MQHKCSMSTPSSPHIILHSYIHLFTLIRQPCCGGEEETAWLRAQGVVLYLQLWYTTISSTWTNLALLKLLTVAASVADEIALCLSQSQTAELNTALKSGTWNIITHTRGSADTSGFMIYVQRGPFVVNVQNVFLSVHWCTSAYLSACIVLSLWSRYGWGGWFWLCRRPHHKWRSPGWSHTPPRRAALQPYTWKKKAFLNRWSSRKLRSKCRKKKKRHQDAFNPQYK